MKDDKEVMCYVAADPTQPGAAWAAVVDDHRDDKTTAKDIAGWVKKGANIERVTVERAREMLLAWKRPGHRKDSTGEMFP